MTQAQIVLWGDSQRDRAIRWIARLRQGTRVIFKEPRRTLPQNEKMWAALTDVATQLVWKERKLTPAQWKLLFMSLLKREMDLIENLDGSGFVDLNSSSSDLSVAEMSDLIELILQFGAQHGVVFQGDRP